jgi:hypothetical protein
MQPSIARLTRDTLPDFFGVHSAANGADWCFCSAWWLPTWEGWGERSAEENHTVRQTQFDQGIFDILILRSKEMIPKSLFWKKKL